MIDDGLKATVTDEESRYRHTLLRQHLHDVDWLEAIILMKQGKWRKALRFLDAIAESQGPYSDSAREIVTASR